METILSLGVLMWQWEMLHSDHRPSIGPVSYEETRERVSRKGDKMWRRRGVFSKSFPYLARNRLPVPQLRGRAVCVFLGSRSHQRCFTDFLLNCCQYSTTLSVVFFSLSGLLTIYLQDVCVVRFVKSNCKSYARSSSARETLHLSDIRHWVTKSRFVHVLQ